MDNIMRIGTRDLATSGFFGVSGPRGAWAAETCKPTQPVLVPGTRARVRGADALIAHSQLPSAAEP